MTDEELGRKWCGAIGKEPHAERGGGRSWVEADAQTLATCAADEWPGWFSRCVRGEVAGRYDTEAAAYAVVGAALRALWAFADESRRQCGEASP